MIRQVSCEFEYGKASVCFPLKISRSSFLGALAAEDQGRLSGEVAGFNTQKTYEAGAATVRVQVSAGAMSVPPGAHLVTIRAEGYKGFLPGLAASRCGGSDTETAKIGLEIVIFGRPDNKWKDAMHTPENVLRELFPDGSAVEVRFVKALANVQHDCPPQWLRDRLLRLADGVETDFSCDFKRDNAEEFRATLELAGLEPNSDHTADMRVLPADHGDRVGKDELGWWVEEMKLNPRCGASVESDVRDETLNQAGYESFPGIASMC